MTKKLSTISIMICFLLNIFACSTAYAAGDVTPPSISVTPVVTHPASQLGIGVITSDSESGVKTVKWASGSQNAAYFNGGSAGSDILVNITNACVGYDHTMLLKNDGTVWTNGYNDYGQLGLGDTFRRISPEKIAGLTNIIDLGCSNYFSVFLKSDGTVYSTGYNNYGQLGLGNTSNRSTPVQIPGLTGISKIAVGYSHVLFLKGDGTVYAVGANGYGQLGLGDTTNRLSPVQISGLSNITQIAAGDSYSAFLKDDGTVYVTGINDCGQLGMGDTTNRSTPVVIPGLSNVTQISAKSYCTMFLKNDGTVYGAGYNSDGELGLGDTTDRTTPTQITSLTNITHVLAGDFETIFLKNDGTLWISGWNFYGQLGLGDTTDRNIPVQLSGMSNVVQASGGMLATVFVKSDGTAYVTGSNFNKQLGLSRNEWRNSPTQISELTDVNQIAVGGNHTVFLKNDGTVYTVGRNYYGELGLGNFVDKCTLTQVTGLTNITQISAGNANTMFLKSDGTVYATGENNYGQLGLGDTTKRNAPVQIAGLTNVTQIAEGYKHAIFLKNDGTVYATGRNNCGQLGLGDTTTRSTPVQIPGLTNVIKIAAGEYYSVFLKSDGTVWTTGYNAYGQLGLGDKTNRTSPTQIAGLTNITQISVGYFHTVFLKNDGTVWTTGDNSEGALGLGDTTDRTSPIQIAGLTNITQISAGCYQTTFLKNDGTVWSVGNDNFGQLGLGDFAIQRLLPEQVPGVTNIVKLAVGSTAVHMAYLRSNGTVLITGDNEYGQLGIGTSTSTYYPVQIPNYYVTQNGVYTVYAMDNSNNETVQTINITNVDTKLPTITLTQPTSGNGTISATVSDDSGIAVKKWADGNQPITYFASSGNTLTQSAFYVNSNGIYTVYAKDNIGNEVTETITLSDVVPDVTAPTVNIPTEGHTAASITATANASDISLPMQYLFNIDGVDQGTWQYSNSYTFTGLTANTTHAIKYKAKDGAGNISGYSDILNATTSAAGLITIKDVGDFSNNDDASDIRVIFKGADDESKIDSYKIIAALASGTQPTDLANSSLTTAATNTVTGNYMAEPKKGRQKIHLFTLPSKLQTYDGHAINSAAGPLKIYVLSVATPGNSDRLSDAKDLAEGLIGNNAGARVMAQKPIVLDTANNGSGLDLKVTFKPSKSEANIASYRVIASITDLTLSQAENVPAAGYKEIIPSNSNINYITTMGAAQKIQDGVTAIQNGTAYRVYILAIGKNGYANVLSTPSKIITLSQYVPGVSAIRSIKVANVGNGHDSSNIKVSFYEPSAVTGVQEYRIFIAPSASTLTQPIADGISDSSLYQVVATTGKGAFHSITLDIGKNDYLNVALAAESYKVYVLTVGKNGCANKLSAASGNVILN